MPIVKITCPHCSYSKELEASAIPAGVTSATCPKCRQKFELETACVTVPISTDYSKNVPLIDISTVPVTSHHEIPKDKTVTPRMIRFAFTGSGREYFGIWIVNTLLKIVTLGAYSAWAKVRKRSYFYGNTLLNNSTFSYTADPKILFRGWLIAAVFFLLYSVSSKVSPQLSTILVIVFFFILPWLIVKSRLFNLRNSSHRNIHFAFTPNYRDAYMVFIWFPFLIPFTLGLIFPYVVYRQKKFFTGSESTARIEMTISGTPDNSIKKSSIRTSATVW